MPRRAITHVKIQTEGETRARIAESGARGDAYEEPRYAIGVVATRCGIHPQTLRQYERLGLVEPHRTRGNFRLYSEADIERLLRIQRLVNDLGVNLAGAEVILNMREQLLAMRRQLLDMHERMR